MGDNKKPTKFDDRTDQSRDVESFAVIKGISIGAIIFSVLAIAVFFLSGTPTKIRAMRVEKLENQEKPSESANIIDEDIKNIINKIDKDDLLDYIESKNESEGETEKPEEKEPEEKSLEEAYKEAEDLFPEKVTASKRLKTISDIKAVDYVYYIVEKGDTLSKLSAYFEIPIGQLIEINGIKNPNLIRTGQILIFPSETKQPDRIIKKTQG